MSAFSNAQKYEFVPKITDANYRANINRIEELKERKIELAYKSSNDLLEMDSTKASAISRIKSQLTIFRCQRGKLYSQIEAIQSNQKFDIASVENDFTSLEEFFPNQVDTDRLSQVESFHKTISKIFETDFDSAIKNLRDLIGLFSMQIADLENQLEEVKSASNLSKVVLAEYALIEREIVQLENENKKHDELKSLTEDKKIKVEDCETKTIEQAKIVEGLINAEMKRLNTFFSTKTTMHLL